MSANRDTSERSNTGDRNLNDGMLQEKKKVDNVKTSNQLKPEVVSTTNLKEDNNNNVKSNTPTQTFSSFKKKQRPRRKNKPLVKSRPLISYLKLSIRHLPPLLSETEFFNQIYKVHPDFEDLIVEHYYVMGEYNINPFIPGVSSRCYICMENEKSMMLIGSAIKNMEFKDCKFTEIKDTEENGDTFENKGSDTEVFKPVVEKSIYDKMPTEKIVPGNQNAAIVNNPIYKLFVQYSEDKEKKDIPDSFFKLFASNKLKIEQEAKLSEKQKKKIAMKGKKAKKIKEEKQKEVKDNSNAGVKKEKVKEKEKEKEYEGKVKPKKKRKKTKKKKKEEGKSALSGANPTTSTSSTTLTTSTTSNSTSKNKPSQKKNKQKPDSNNTQRTVAQGTSKPQSNSSTFTSPLKSSPSFPSASPCAKKKTLVKREDS